MDQFQAMTDDDKPFVVWVWNGEHAAKREWKRVRTQAEADEEARALKVHKFEVEIERKPRQRSP